MSLECPICFENYHFLKYLSCRHSFCLKCLIRLKHSNEDGKNVILCPLDRELTILSSVGENGLMTQFDMKLTCDNCSEDYLVSKCWWCKTCEESICSTCAMLKHRKHDDCDEWDHYELVKDCVNLFHSFDLETKHLDDQIHNYCQQLEESLKSRYSYIHESKKFLANIDTAFGQITSSSGKVTFKKIEKPLRTILKFVTYHNTNNALLDIDVLKELPQKQILPKKLTLPDINDIVDKVFETVVQQPDNEDALPLSNDKKACLDKPHKSPFQLAWNDQKLKFNVTYPATMCSIPNGLLILDSKAIYKYEHACNKVTLSKQWSHVEENCFAFPPNMTYHSKRNSIFVSVQTDANEFGTLEEYSLPNLSFVQQSSLPNFSQRFQFAAPCLIVGSNDGRIICAKGVDFNGYIWMKAGAALYTDWWTLVWCGKGYQKFLSLLMITRENNEILLVLSDTVIYEFLLSSTAVKFLRKYRFPSSDYCSFMIVKNDLFYFDDSGEKLRTFFEFDENKDISVHCARKKDEVVLMSASICGKFIYECNIFENVLRIGNIRLQSQLSK